MSVLSGAEEYPLVLYHGNPEHVSHLTQRFPWLKIADSAAGSHFVYQSQGLEYHDGEANISLAFDSKALHYRTDRIANEGLRQALNVKKNPQGLIVDLTAGAGVDAVLMTQWGFTVIAVERHPVVACLLEDALYNLALEPGFETLQETLTLVHASAQDFLADHHNSPTIDIIYLDPMFPSKEKSAAVKKKMRWIQQLCGPDFGNQGLLHLARKKARVKVVVKRPNAAPFLDDTQPNYQVPMKKHRYDVYLPLQDLTRATLR